MVEMLEGGGGRRRVRAAQDMLAALLALPAEGDPSPDDEPRRTAQLAEAAVHLSRAGAVEALMNAAQLAINRRA
jgi:hypothetical protein